MTPQTPFDREAGHRHFAAHCFGDTWAILGKVDRGADDERRIVAAAVASVYHWMHLLDCTSQHLSFSYWQVSRVHAVLSRATEALRYAEICDSYSSTLSPFYRGDALEAIARAALLTGDSVRAEQA